MTKPLYLLVATETGPEADDPQDLEYASLADARRAWVEQVEHYLADGAAVRLHGGSDHYASCTATYRKDGAVVLEIHLFIEDGYDTDCSDDDERSEDAFDEVTWLEENSDRVDSWDEVFA